MLLHDPAVDRYVTPSLARAGAFEPFETELLLDALRPGDVALDIGAHVGYYTLLMARRVGPRGRVFAFEPDPANFDLLRRNVALNGYANVVLGPLAAADRGGPARLHLSGDNAGDHRLYPAGGEARPSVEVQTVALDNYFAGYSGPIDLVKIDIQGAECAALEGMRGLLARQAHVTLFTEFWPMGLAASGRSAAAYLDLLRELGFRLSRVSEPHRAVVRADPAELLRDYPPESDRFTNLLGVKAADPVGPAARGAWPDADRLARWRAAGDLRAFERRVSSQNGEDGILGEVFRRVGAGGRYAVEFAAGDGAGGNAAHLLQGLGWAGLLVAADEGAAARLADRYHGRPDVRAVRAVVTSDNVEDLLAESGAPGEIDLLSIDLDGNDYWVWRAVERWRPRVVVIEYNASKPPPQRWVMKEDAGRAWDGTDYFGASLASLADLGRSKGYALVATDSRGVNAFFVRADLAPPGRFLDPAVHYHYSPPDYGPHRGGHPPGEGPAVEV
jgi:FkbM family methyltransferase